MEDVSGGDRSKRPYLSNRQNICRIKCRLPSRDWSQHRINPIALFAVYRRTRDLRWPPATRNCRAEKYRQCAIQFTVLNFRHWLTGNWSDAFAAIYSECRFPEFGRLSARYASAALFVKLRNRVTPLSSDFRCTDSESRAKKKRERKIFNRKFCSKLGSSVIQNSLSHLTGIRSSSEYLALFIAKYPLSSIIITCKLLGIRHRDQGKNKPKLISQNKIRA